MLNVIAQRARDASQVAVESRPLMRIFTVAQILHLGEVEIQTLRKPPGATFQIDCREIVADGAVVGSGVGERLACQAVAGGQADRATR